MSTISESNAPNSSHHPPDERLWCKVCHTDAHLMIETIEPHTSRAPDLVEVAYSCAKCDFFYTHPATIEHVSRVLDRPGASFNLLQFGDDYIHCGEPMVTVGEELWRISNPVHTKSGQRDKSFDVYLQTKILRCSCGFQLKLPR